MSSYITSYIAACLCLVLFFARFLAQGCYTAKKEASREHMSNSELGLCPTCSNNLKHVNFFT